MAEVFFLIRTERFDISAETANAFCYVDFFDNSDLIKIITSEINLHHRRHLIPAELRGNLRELGRE